MEIIKHMLNNWSTYQQITLFLLVVLIIALLLLGIWIFTKNRKFLLFALTSLILSLLITFIGSQIANLVFEVPINYIFSLTPMIVIAMNIIHLGMSVGYYNSKKMKKYPDLNDLRKEFGKDSIQISIFTILLFTSFLIFTDGLTFSFLLLTEILIVLTTWLNFFLVKFFLKDE